jgi:tRNA threonylcarbamoyladenosine biosynthesis protein TsaE
MGTEREQKRRRCISTSPEQTEALGGELAGDLEAGDVVVVSGEVGTGKTTLIRGACRQLGVADPITSPTFTVGHRYRGRLPVSHLDLYRLADLDEEEPALLDDYLDQATVSFVEWPALVEPRLRGGRVLQVRLEHEGGDRRMVEIGPLASASLGQ